MIQLQVINYLLNTRDSSMLQMNNITDEFFDEYKEEYNFIVNHLKEYGNIPDKVSFLDSFPNFDIIEVNESSDYLIDKLYDDRNTKKLASIFNDIRAKLMSGNIDEAMEIYTTSTDTIIKAKHVESIDITKDTSRYCYESYYQDCEQASKRTCQRDGIAWEDEGQGNRYSFRS